MIIILVLLLALAGCAAEPSSPNASRQSTDRAAAADASSEALWLAELDAGSMAGDHLVSQFDRSLNAAAGACSESRSQLASMVERGVEIAGEGGVTVSHMDLLVELVRAIPPGSDGMDCAELLGAVLVILRA